MNDSKCPYCGQSITEEFIENKEARNRKSEAYAIFFTLFVTFPIIIGLGIGIALLLNKCVFHYW